MGNLNSTVTLKDSSSVTLRLATANDLEASLQFFRSIPESDRSYLRRDVTEREVIESRIEDIRSGHAISILALDGDSIVGDVALFTVPISCYSKTVEVRFVVKSDYRGKGLGTALVKEAIDLAREKGFRKLEADVMDIQKGAIKVMENAGFEVEGELTNFVVDANGDEHTFIILGKLLD